MPPHMNPKTPPGVSKIEKRKDKLNNTRGAIWKMVAKMDVQTLREELELFGIDVPVDDDDFIWEKGEERCP